MSGFLNESDKLIGYVLLEYARAGTVFSLPFLPPTPGNTKWQEERLPNHYPVQGKAQHPKPLRSRGNGRGLESRGNGEMKARSPLKAEAEGASISGQ